MASTITAAEFVDRYPVVWVVTDVRYHAPWDAGYSVAWDVMTPRWSEDDGRAVYETREEAVGAALRMTLAKMEESAAFLKWRGLGALGRLVNRLRGGWEPTKPWREYWSRRGGTDLADGARRLEDAMWRVRTALAAMEAAGETGATPPVEPPLAVTDMPESFSVLRAPAPGTHLYQIHIDCIGMSYSLDQLIDIYELGEGPTHFETPSHRWSSAPADVNPQVLVDGEPFFFDLDDLDEDGAFESGYSNVKNFPERASAVRYLRKIAAEAERRVADAIAIVEAHGRE